MTCQELQCYLENPLRTEIYAYREALPLAVSEHLAHCDECALLLEEQKALGIRLEMARDAAPQISAELTVKVLDDYRRQMSAPRSSVLGGALSLSNPWLRGAAAAAVLIVIFTIAIFLSRSHAPIVAKKIAPAEKQIPATVTEEPAVSPKEAAVAERPQQKVPAERVRKTAAVATRSPLPPGFTSLMYCDEMTCTGPMEVIRVELPPPAGQAMNPAAAPVMAEVLVGEDGIARGIRIVQ